MRAPPPRNAFKNTDGGGPPPGSLSKCAFATAHFNILLNDLAATTKKGSTHIFLRFLVDFGARFQGNSLMPRKLRLEYPGAMYHVMSRGNRRFEPKLRWNMKGKRRNIWAHPLAG
jgi:hypothetical protein